MSGLHSSAISNSKKLDFVRDQLAGVASRQPVLLFTYAHDLVKAGASFANDIEKYNVIEQALIAALECGQDHHAERLHRQLVHQFGHKSLRVRKLQGLMLESKGKYDEAIALYKSLLSTSPIEAFVPKRLSAVHKAKGQIIEAIHALEQLPVFREKTPPAAAADDEDDRPAAPSVYAYLELYPADLSAVRELLTLHWACGKVPRALHYANEAVLLDPCNSAAYTRVGEMAYAAGKLDDSATAFAQSLRLTSGGAKNLRALYGIWMVALECLRHAKGGGGGKSAGSTTDVSVSAGNGVENNVPRCRQVCALAVSKLKLAYQSSSATASFLELMVQKYHVTAAAGGSG